MDRSLNRLLGIGFVLCFCFGCTSIESRTTAELESKAKQPATTKSISEETSPAKTDSPRRTTTAFRGPLERQSEPGANRSPTADEPLRILTWNVESEGNDPEVISEQLQEFEGYHIFALTEVLKYNLRRYSDAIGHGEDSLYRFVSSQTGRSDRLEIVFDTSRLDLIECSELFLVGDTQLNDWRHRSPLVAHFRDKATSTEFLLMVNHLARGDDELRTEQASGLRKWAKQQTLPVIAIGDFNFDFVFETEKGNAAFDAFLADDTWKWIRPGQWIDTNWADRNEDGEDDYPGSMLDFAFVAGEAKTWSAECNVIVRRRDFPDSRYTSDHRPVELVIQIPTQD